MLYIPGLAMGIPRDGDAERGVVTSVGSLPSHGDSAFVMVRYYRRGQLMGYSMATAPGDLVHTSGPLA